MRGLIYTVFTALILIGVFVTSGWESFAAVLFLTIYFRLINTEKYGTLIASVGSGILFGLGMGAISDGDYVYAFFGILIGIINFILIAERNNLDELGIKLAKKIKNKRESKEG